MQYDRLIFLPPTTDMSAEKLAALVTSTYGRDRAAQILVEGNRVEVRWGDWSLRVYYEAGETVRKESEEIVTRFGCERTDKMQLSVCDTWVTIASDDEDYNMKHFNHFVFLLQDLEEELPGAVMFVPLEGTFFDVGNFN
jgi:hypothetical protein